MNLTDLVPAVLALLAVAGLYLALRALTAQDRHYSQTTKGHRS